MRASTQARRQQRSTNKRKRQDTRSALAKRASGRRGISHRKRRVVVLCMPKCARVAFCQSSHNVISVPYGAHLAA